MNNIDFQVTAQDDSERSKHIYEFLIKKTKHTSTTKSKIPKVIVQYWHSLSKLPDDVYECIKSWKVLKEMGFNFKFFDDIKAKEFIQKHYQKEYLASYLKCHHPAMRCDYFRLCYLYIYGGMYIDCDELYLNVSIDDLFRNNNVKLQPLCFNLSSNCMVKNENFLNKEFKSNYIYYFNNNPIISTPKHKLIYLALKSATKKLLEEDNINDIQSTTGPGNLSAAIVNYLNKNKSQLNFIDNWNEISISPWPLSYRNDNRNWRIYNSNDKKWFDSL